MHGVIQKCKLKCARRVRLHHFSHTETEQRTFKLGYIKHTLSRFRIVCCVLLDFSCFMCLLVPCSFPVVCPLSPSVCLVPSWFSPLCSSPLLPHLSSSLLSLLACSSLVNQCIYSMCFLHSLSGHCMYSVWFCLPLLMPAHACPCLCSCRFPVPSGTCFWILSFAI